MHFRGVGASRLLQTISHGHEEADGFRLRSCAAVVLTDLLFPHENLLLALAERDFVVAFYFDCGGVLFSQDLLGHLRDVERVIIHVFILVEGLGLVIQLDRVDV